MSGANKLYLSPRILFSHYTIFIVYPLQGESNIDTFSCRKSNRVVRYNFWNRVASKKCFLSPFLWVCEVWMSCRQVWEPSPARAFVPNWEAQEDVQIKALFQTGGGSLKINFLSPSSSSSAVFMVLWEPSEKDLWLLHELMRGLWLEYIRSGMFVQRHHQLSGKRDENNLF